MKIWWFIKQRLRHSMRGGLSLRSSRWDKECFSTTLDFVYFLVSFVLAGLVLLLLLMFMIMVSGDQKWSYKKCSKLITIVWNPIMKNSKSKKVMKSCWRFLPMRSRIWKNDHTSSYLGIKTIKKCATWEATHTILDLLSHSLSLLFLCLVLISFPLHWGQCKFQLWGKEIMLSFVFLCDFVHQFCFH